MWGGRHKLICTRSWFHMGDVTGSVGTRPKHLPGQGRGLCRSEFVAHSGMRARGCGAERTRPFEARLDEGVAADQCEFARRHRCYS